METTAGKFFLLLVFSLSALHSSVRSPTITRHLRVHYETKKPATSSGMDVVLASVSTLQNSLLRSSLTPEECESFGFLTTKSSMMRLSIIAKHLGICVAEDENNDIVGFIFGVNNECSFEINGREATAIKSIYDDIQLPDGTLLKNYDYCWLAQVCVQKEYQHQGIGWCLCEHFKRIAQDKKYRYAVANVCVDHKRGLAFFEKLGFQTVKKDFPLGKEIVNVMIWDLQQHPEEH